MTCGCSFEFFDKDGSISNAVVHSLATFYGNESELLGANSTGQVKNIRNVIGCAASPTNVILPFRLSHGIGCQYDKKFANS